MVFNDSHELILLKSHPILSNVNTLDLMLNFVI